MESVLFVWLWIFCTALSVSAVVYLCYFQLEIYLLFVCRDCSGCLEWSPAPVPSFSGASSWYRVFFTLPRSVCHLHWRGRGWDNKASKKNEKTNEDSTTKRQRRTACLCGLVPCCCSCLPWLNKIYPPPHCRQIFRGLFRSVLGSVTPSLSCLFYFEALAFVIVLTLSRLSLLRGMEMQWG